MKRITKNIIHFTIIGLTLVLIVAPELFDVPPDMQNRPMPNQQQMQGLGNQAPHDMPNSNKDSNQQNGENPPDKPNGEEPPGMQNNQNQNDIQNGAPMGGQQPPQIDAGIDIFEISFYILKFLILTIFLVYVIMSKANKYTFVETFSTNKRKTIYGISVALLTIAGVIIMNVPFDAPPAPPGQMEQPGMSNQSNIEYNAEKTINSSKDENNENYSAKDSNKLAVLVTDKITSNLKNFTLNKTGNADGEDSTSFYGTNAGLLAKSGATLNIEGATVNTDAKGANGVFSFGGSMKNNSGENDGTNVTVKNTTINTKQDDSGGVMTTGGGIMKVLNCIINTFGTSSAAIRTDRGGGNVDVDGGTYTTSGQGSPSIYSTANVNVCNATLNSNTSEGVVIEGKNTVSLNNCKLTDSNTKLNGQSTTYKNVFLYQSMSGDSESGTSQFSSKNSEIVTNCGDSFYVTNTKAVISLENNTILNNDNSGNFLRIQKDSWGNAGSNGGDVVLNMNNQKTSGNIDVDQISKLEMNMSNNSYWEGSVNGDNISMKIDKNSKIKLTGDCHIKSLDSDYSNIDFNGYKLYVDGNEIGSK